MKVVDGLGRIRDMLATRGARPETLACVDGVMENARRHDAIGQSPSASLVQLIKMLERTPAGRNDIGVYNDLVALEDQLVEAAGVAAAERERELDRPAPKTSGYYKRLKQKQRDGGS